MKGNSSHRTCSVRKDVLRTLAKFTGKHLCQSLFLIKIQASGLQLYQKENLAQVFSCEFCQISKNTFFTEHLLTMTASESRQKQLQRISFFPFERV